MEKFIITSDAKTAEQFKIAGFKLLSENSGVYTFLNNNTNTKFNFDSIDGKKYSFTNTLMF